MLNGRVLDVGERSTLQGSEVRALAAADVDDELWQVVADPGARYHEGGRRGVAVHDERVHESTAVRLTSNPIRPTRFFTVPR